jgi:hypothetical protein
MQDYSSEKSYRRWRGNLGFHLDKTKELVKKNSVPRLPDSACWSDVLTRNPITKLAVYNFGHVVWGLFARAFWPIYMTGRNNHYGTVILSFDRYFDDSPALFEITEDLRKLREAGGEPGHLKAFARQIRNDWESSNRIRIPKELSGGRDVFFQSIYIPRTRLPGGYLHNRLVPVFALPASSYACIVPLKFWPADFMRKWSEGEQLLSAGQLAEFQKAFPGVIP